MLVINYEETLDYLNSDRLDNVSLVGQYSI